jgi:hypothetical protein
MDNSTAAPLIGDILLANQLELVATTTVAGTIYGVAFTLFCLYIHSLIPRLRGGDRKIQARFMLGYSTVIMLCGLYSLVSNAWVTQDAYIKHSNYVGGPFNYIGTTFRSNIGITVGFVCQTIIEILTSAIQVRSCFSPTYPPNRLNYSKDLACMDNLERHELCSCSNCVALVVFLDLHG